MAPTSAVVTVMGKMSSEAFGKCKLVVEVCQSSQGKADKLPAIHVVPMLPAEYEEYVMGDLKQLTTSQHAEDVVCIMEGGGAKPKQYIGGESAFMSWIQGLCGPVPEQDVTLVRASCLDAWRSHCLSTNRQYCYITLSSAERGVLGTLIIELYNDVCPNTCEKFMMYLTGETNTWPKLQYKGTPIHRIVPNGYIQGGDVVDGSGAGPLSSTFLDETFAIKHDRMGLIGMANLGIPNTNSAQFYITLDKLPWLDKKRVAFGRVVDGLRLLKQLEAAPLRNERPIDEVVISDCGLYTPGAAAY